ncbi:MAG: hypothetical protein RPR97_09140 [Colwellia sp.]
MTINYVFSIESDPIDYNSQMMDLYDRLQARGKPKKVALVALVALVAFMRKLLVLAYGILKSGKPFDENYSNA